MKSNTFTLAACVVFLASGISCCVSERAVYDNIQLNECLNKKGEVYCEGQKDYDTYKKERESLLKAEKQEN